MKKLTEQQLRLVIREEIESYLIEEGFNLNKIGRAIGNAIGIAAMLKAAEPTAIALDDFRQTSGYQKEVGNAVDELGLKDLNGMVKSELGEDQPEILKNMQDSSKLYNHFMDKGINLADEAKMKEIGQRIASSPASVSKEDKLAYSASQKFKALSTAVARNEKLKSLGPLSQSLLTKVDPASKESLEQLGRDMIANISKDEQAKETLLNLFVQEVNSDLRSVGQAVASGYTAEGELKPTSYGIDDETAFKLAAVYASMNDMLPNQSGYSWVDVDKALISNKDKLYKIGKVDADEHWNFNARLPQVVADNKVFTKDDLQQWTNELLPQYQQNMYTAEYKEEGSVKESKVNKLRQRLNELRGVYV